MSARFQALPCSTGYREQPTSRACRCDPPPSDLVSQRNRSVTFDDHQMRRSMTHARCLRIRTRYMGQPASTGIAEASQPADPLHAFELTTGQMTDITRSPCGSKPSISAMKPGSRVSPTDPLVSLPMMRLTVLNGSRRFEAWSPPRKPPFDRQ